MPVTIRLAWSPNPVAQAISGYQVFESKDNAAFGLRTTVPALTPTLEILNPLPGFYRWYLKAVNFVGVSPASGISDGPDIPTPPEVPTVTVVVS